jgi:hypothetical protein
MWRMARPEPIASAWIILTGPRGGKRNGDAGGPVSDWEEEHTEIKSEE